MGPNTPMTNASLRKLGIVCAVVDAVQAVIGISWQSLSDHRPILDMILLNDSFWMALVLLSTLKLATPKWFMAIFGFYLSFRSTLSLIRCFSLFPHHEYVVGAACVVYIFVALLNVAFILSWWKAAANTNAKSYRIAD